MKIIITEHAEKRLKEERQVGITITDITAAAESIPGKIPSATRFRGFLAQSGRIFDIVAKDTESIRLVITVIGK
ncbi:MAG: hypothetical protein ACOYEK_04555 [bacterium]|jgi:hypothetical protein